MIKKSRKIVLNLPSIILYFSQIEEIIEILKDSKFTVSSIQIKKNISLEESKKIISWDELLKVNYEFITNIIFIFKNEDEKEIEITIGKDLAFLTFPEDLSFGVINQLQKIYYILIRKKSLLNPKNRKLVTLLSVFTIAILVALNHYFKFLPGKELNYITWTLLVLWGFNFFLWDLVNYSKLQIKINTFHNLFYYKLIYIFYGIINVLLGVSYFVFKYLNIQ